MSGLVPHRHTDPALSVTALYHIVWNEPPPLSQLANIAAETDRSLITIDDRGKKKRKQKTKKTNKTKNDSVIDVGLLTDKINFKN